jgi:hypothetical protein
MRNSSTAPTISDAALDAYIAAAHPGFTLPAPRIREEVRTGLAAAYPHLVAQAVATLERLRKRHEDLGMYQSALAYLGAIELLKLPPEDGAEETHTPTPTTNEDTA